MTSRVIASDGARGNRPLCTDKPRASRRGVWPTCVGRHGDQGRKSGLLPPHQLSTLPVETRGSSLRFWNRSEAGRQTKFMSEVGLHYPPFVIARASRSRAKVRLLCGRPTS